jgi:hypothetical protein
LPKMDGRGVGQRCEPVEENDFLGFHV